MERKLRLINVNKKYKLTNKESFQALYNIDLDFEKGELVSIIGESGSGKSTLMNLIGGLDSDFSGQIIADGEHLEKLTDKQLDKYRKNKIGFVFQSFNLISHLSILDNVTLALTLSNVSEKEKVAKATEMLKRVGLENQLKKKPNQLSGGQKQRVAIARALINDPEIIIADEPTGALDSDTSMQILEILKEIADSGKLVIMVTHSEKVASVSSRVVKLSDGRIVDDKINENYQKTLPKENPLQSQDANEISKTPDTKTDTNKKKNTKERIEVLYKKYQITDTNKKKNTKDRQNLSMWSAVRLSFHNMWASRVKNLLMSFGVAIGIGSLILMMCFSSGITDYIDDTMKSYSNPEIVSITKLGTENAASSLFSYNPFTDDEKAELIEKINNHLETKGYDFKISEENCSNGFNMMTIMADAKVTYSPSGEDLNDAEDLEKETVYYLYTIPPYYTNKNVISGTMSQPSTMEDGKITQKGGIMLSKGIINKFTDGNPIGKDVEISFNFSPDNDPTKATRIPIKDQICGIMDTSVMSNWMVVYIDYDYLHDLFVENGIGDSFAPTTIYIDTSSATNSVEITNEINSYISTLAGYTGSIEDQLANMFNNMSSIIGTSLVVISCISLLVSAIMILVVLYMSVTERTKEIGVLKSIGARRKDIKRIFTSESLLIGILSGILGIFVNLILTLIVWLTLTNTIGMCPISYRWWYFAVAMAVSIVISMLSGLYPASKAAKLDPVESLRRE